MRVAPAQVREHFVDDDDVRYLEGLSTPVADGVTVSIIPAAWLAADIFETNLQPSDVVELHAKNIALVSASTFTQTPIFLPLVSALQQLNITKVVAWDDIAWSNFDVGDHSIDMDYHRRRRVRSMVDTGFTANPT